MTSRLCICTIFVSKVGETLRGAQGSNITCRIIYTTSFKFTIFMLHHLHTVKPLHWFNLDYFTVGFASVEAAIR